MRLFGLCWLGRVENEHNVGDQRETNGVDASVEHAGALDQSDRAGPDHSFKNPAFLISYVAIER